MARFDTCQVVRHKLVTRSTLDMATGEETPAGQEWVTEKCGTPIFDKEGEETGECKSCRKGWSVPTNYRAEA